MSRNKYLLKRFGITESQYDQLLQDQNENCAVCGRHHSVFKQRLCVDHDHHTGHVRGLLCTYCNRRVVGRYRRDSGASLLKAAYDYLNRDYPGWIIPPKKKKKRVKRLERNISRSRLSTRPVRRRKKDVQPSPD